MKTELSIELIGTEENRLCNINRERTKAFRMRSNRNYGNGLTSHAFCELLYDSIALVKDCYTIHSKHLESPFGCFLAQS